MPASKLDVCEHVEEKKRSCGQLKLATLRRAPNLGTLVPKMGSLGGSAIPGALFPRARQSVLGLLFGLPERRFYLREIVSLTGLGVGSVQRELERLSAANIITRTRGGQHVYFQAEPACPIFEELRMIVRKTLGASAVIREAMLPLADRIEVAFIFGSLARGTDKKGSDIDLLVVGDVTFADVVDAVRGVEEETRREVNAVVYTSAEFTAKLAARNHFLTNVCAGETLFLIGGDRELAALSRQ